MSTNWRIDAVKSALADKKLSARELAADFFSRIGAQNPALNAYLTLSPERAYAQADKIDALIASFAISILAHFAVGAVKSLITIRSWWASGLEMTIVGIIEAVVTYGLGLAFGAIA